MGEFYLLNYAVICLLLVVAIIYFVLAINKLFTLKGDFENALSMTRIVSCRIDFNGLIINHSENFLELLKLMNFKGDPVNKELFEILDTVDTDNEKIVEFISALETKKEATFELNLKYNNEIRIHKVTGRKASDSYGVIENYLLTIEDVTERVQGEFELEGVRSQNKNLYVELAGYEEELQRNFEHLDIVRNQIKEIQVRHKLVVDSLDVGIFEYDFVDRQFIFSDVMAEMIMRDHKNHTSDEILEYIKSDVTNENYTELLTVFYDVLTNGKTKFKLPFYLSKNKSNLMLKGKVYFNANEEPIFLICYTTKDSNK
ncbi:MAG: hypothetical protein ACK5LT_04215 [Lachnospirales bacterium]